MGFKDKVNNFYKMLIHPKVVKFSCIGATFVWISSVVLAILIGFTKNHIKKFFTFFYFSLLEWMCL